MTEYCCLGMEKSQIADLCIYDGKFYLFKPDYEYGIDIREDIKFCPFCGSKLKNEL